MNERDFLSTIVEAKRRDVRKAERSLSLREIRARALDARVDAPRHALRAGLSGGVAPRVIAEIKRASPSKGDLRRDLDAGVVARGYERAGAAAVSVLTEEHFFKGSLDDLRAVRAAVRLPVLRKDFVVEEWQVYESAAAGADVLLLIVAALDGATLGRLREIAEDELGMDALVEVHTADELRRAESAGARLVGVNNRDLRSFRVSLDTSVELAAAASPGTLLVSESGLRTRADLERLGALGYAGFLIGETFMRAADPGQALRALLEEATGDAAAASD